MQLELNRKDKVVSAKAGNADGQVVLDGMDLKGVSADVAVNALVGSMVQNGYLREDANSVLISVQSNKDGKAQALQISLSETADETLKNAKLSGAVLSQTVLHDSELEKLAQEYGISTGKAQLIQQIMDKEPTMTFKDLAGCTWQNLRSWCWSPGFKTSTAGNGDRVSRTLGRGQNLTGARDTSAQLWLPVITSPLAWASQW